jgi:hypothetical protein
MFSLLPAWLRVILPCPFLTFSSKSSTSLAFDGNVIGVVGRLPGGNDGRSVVEGRLHGEVPTASSKAGKVIAC